MTIIVDPPNASGHGRMWSHLASDTSYDELHEFARTLGIPERGFDRDHSDVPSEWYEQVLALEVRPCGPLPVLAGVARVEQVRLLGEAAEHRLPPG